jgi:hypothetical protein
VTAESKEERVRKVKEFLQKCTGILKDTQILSDIAIEKSGK